MLEFLPDPALLLRSPWLWAAGAMGLFLVGLLLGAAGATQQERRRKERKAERREEAGYHLAMGLSSVIAGNPDLAIRELREVVERDTEAVEIYLLLGDLLRERGRVEQSIRIHKAVLKRKGLSPSRKTAALTSLSRDFAKAGFVDRAMRTFREVSERDPSSLIPLHYLEKLHEEEGAWDEALVVQQKLLSMRGDREDEKVLGYLHWKVGEGHRETGRHRKALRSWSRAVDAWPRTTPAHLATGDLHREQGDGERAEEAWMRAARLDPDRAWLALERLDPLWREQGREKQAHAFAKEWMRNHPHVWRVPLYLARRALDRDDLPEAMTRLRQAVERNPMSRNAMGLALRLAVPADPGDTSSLPDLLHFLEEAEAFAEPRLCIRCRYRTTELLWRCPHCHAWDSFVDA